MEDTGIKEVLPLVDLGQYDKASQLLGDKLKSNPTDINLLMLQGTILFMQKQMDDAIDAFENLVSLHPKSYKGYYNLGLCQNSVGKKDEALISFCKSILLNPTYEKAITEYKELSGDTSGKNFKGFVQTKEPLVLFKKGALLYNWAVPESYLKFQKNRGLFFMGFGAFFLIGPLIVMFLGLRFSYLFLGLLIPPLSFFVFAFFMARKAMATLKALRAVEYRIYENNLDILEEGTVMESIDRMPSLTVRFTKVPIVKNVTSVIVNNAYELFIGDKDPQFSEIKKELSTLKTIS